MNSHATRIDSSHTCWGYDDDALCAVILHRTQESGLSSASFSRQEYANSRMLNKVPGISQFVVLHHVLTIH